MKRKGFTIIELVIVLVVMAIASAGLAAVVVEVMQGSAKAEVISAATGLATGEAERVFRLPFANIADEHRGSPQSYSGDFSNYSWEVRADNIDTAQPNLGTDTLMETYKAVEVRVHHSSIGYLQVRFLRANY